MNKIKNLLIFLLILLAVYFFFKQLEVTAQVKRLISIQNDVSKENDKISASMFIVGYQEGIKTEKNLKEKNIEQYRKHCFEVLNQASERYNLLLNIKEIQSLVYDGKVEGE